MPSLMAIAELPFRLPTASPATKESYPMTLGIYPKDTNVAIHRDTRPPSFIAAMSPVAKLWKEPRYPLKDEWVKKMWGACAHTHTHTQE